MRIISSIKACIWKTIDFTGRGSRSEFWFYILFILLFTIFLLFPFEYISNTLDDIDSIRTAPSSDEPLWMEKVYNILLIFMFLPLLPLPAAISRRLHDIGRSGFWQLLPFVFMLLLVIGLFLSGTNFEGLAYLVVMGCLLALPIFSFFLILFWLSKKGHSENNKFGPATI